MLSATEELNVFKSEVVSAMTVLAYLVYLVISVPLTIWVARTLSRNGRVFLVDVFDGNDEFADAVNRLLVVGFYLVNLGFVTLFLRTRDTVSDARGAIEQLSMKLGTVLVVLGVLHLLNVWIFNAIRRRSRLEEMTTPPVPPNAFVGTGPFQPPFAGPQQPMPQGY
jgi:cytochrome b561